MKGRTLPGIWCAFAAMVPAYASGPVPAHHEGTTISLADDAARSATLANWPKRLSIIVFLRHGIRSPLSGETPRASNSDVWARWTTPPGMLTANGYRNAQYLGRWFGAAWRAQGLLRDRCLGGADILVHSNNVPRAIESAQAFAAGLAPGCPPTVEHNPEDRRDPIFDPIASGAEPFDPAAALAAEHRKPAVLLAAHAREIAMAQQILGCAPAMKQCGVEAGEAGPITADHDGIRADTKTVAAAGVAQSLLLQFVEGLPMPQWRGQPLGPAGVERLSALHALPFVIQARAPYPAARLASPFLGQVARQFASTEALPRIRVYVGHDNTISALTARLGIDFQAKGYAHNDPPIGGAFGFELLGYADGDRRVRSFFIAQTPTQLRHVSPLASGDRPWISYHAILGCDAPAVRGCPLPRFLAILDALRIKPA